MALSTMRDAFDHRVLAENLTRPRAMKCLIPLMTGHEPLSRMASAELRQRLIFETADAPVSVTLDRDTWRASARVVLDAVRERYAGCGG